MRPVSNVLPSHVLSEPAKVLGKRHALSSLAVTVFSGPDALAFLQGQLTNDLAGAAADQARLAGYCTAQGRLLGSGVFFQADANLEDVPKVLAIMRADILASVIKRLSMFVLRAKVKISQAVALTVSGVTCVASDLAALSEHVKVSLPVKPYQLSRSEFGYWICAPQSNAKTLRWWWIADTQQLGKAQQLIDQLQLEPSVSWDLADLEAGLPWIEALTQDLFIPQTVNLDLIDGVSFSKGCYPGQELVARSHYRGTLKRRMAYGFIERTISTSTEGADGQSHLTINPGDDVINTLDDNQACGRVINAVHSEKRTYLLFEAPFTVMDSDSLSLAGYSEIKIEQLALPYPIVKVD